MKKAAMVMMVAFLVAVCIVGFGFPLLVNLGRRAGYIP